MSTTKPIEAWAVVCDDENGNLEFYDDTIHERQAHPLLNDLKRRYPDAINPRIIKLVDERLLVEARKEAERWRGMTRPKDPRAFSSSQAFYQLPWEKEGEG